MQLTFETTSDLAHIRRPRREWLSPPVITGTVKLLDALAVFLSGLAAYALWRGVPAFEPFILYSLLIGVLLCSNICQLSGAYVYQRLTNAYAQACRLIVIWPSVLAILLLLGFFTGTIDNVSRGWIALWLLLGALGFLIVRLGLANRLRAWARAGLLTQNIVVLGAGDHGRRFVRQLERDEPGVNLIGLFDDRHERTPDYVGGFPVLGTADDLLVFARQYRVDQVVVALPWGAEERLLEWINKLKRLPVDIRLCPDMIGFRLSEPGITRIAGTPLINVVEKPLSGWNWIAKAVEDRVLAALILILVSPLMVAIAIAVRLDSPGPVLFRQNRSGFNNEIFEVWKFRSMIAEDAQATSFAEVPQATRDDPRITRVGRFLRRTSLDELPQFLNVLMGDMSIVGPRPHAVAHTDKYAQLIDSYLARHKVKPGITGWAQVNGYRGETDTLEKMKTRVQYDLYYIENWSLALDIKIVLLTMLVGFSSPNAY